MEHGPGLRLKLLGRWEDLKLNISEFFWSFHPRRNRWCEKCHLGMGNSANEAKNHRCGVDS